MRKVDSDSLSSGWSDEVQERSTKQKVVSKRKKVESSHESDESQEVIVKRTSNSRRQRLDSDEEVFLESNSLRQARESKLAQKMADKEHTSLRAVTQ